MRKLPESDVMVIAIRELSYRPPPWCSMASATTSGRAGSASGAGVDTTRNAHRTAKAATTTAIQVVAWPRPACERLRGAPSVIRLQLHDIRTHGHRQAAQPAAGCVIIVRMGSRIRVFAPATASNLGPGFDVLGLALERPGDLVEAEVRDRPGVEIAEVTGAAALSTNPREKKHMLA